MKKELLINFIKKHTVGGVINKAKWKYTASNKILHARATANNKTFIADVIMNGFDSFGESDYIVCIGDIEKVRLLLAPFDEEVNVKLHATADKVLGFSVFDNDCESYCVAAHPSSMDPVAKNLQDIPDYDVEVLINEEFTTKMLKSKAALKDIDSMSVGMNKDNKFEIVFGYTSSNSNRIRLTPPTNPEKSVIKKAASFPIANIIEVMKSNVDVENGSMFINSMGVIKLVYNTENYNCTYYQFE